MSKSFLKYEEILIGSIWKPADGSSDFVIVTNKNNDLIYYTHTSDKVSNMYDKDAFSFQCRYSLNNQ